MDNNIDNENYPNYYNEDDIKLYDNMLIFMKKYRPTYGKILKEWQYKLLVIQAINNIKHLDLDGQPYRRTISTLEEFKTFVKTTGEI